MMRGRPKTIVVEMAGVACAGKTSLAKIIIAHLQAHGYRCPDLVTIERWRMLFGSNNPHAEIHRLGKFRRMCVLVSQSIRFPKVSFICMIEIFKQLFAVFNAEGLAGYRNLMKFAIAVSATRGARLYDVVIWDEGMISLTQHAARYEGADRAFGRLWRMWDSEHIICVIVDLPLDVAMTRLRNRYASRLSRFSDEELLERFGPGREVVLRLSNKLAKIQSQNILIVDGTVSPERSSGIVTDFLLPRLQRCKSLASDS